MDIKQDIELLAFEQALYKRIAEDVSTKTPGNLRSRVDDYYRGLLEDTGAKSFAVRMGGSTVGTYSFKTAKAKTTVELEVTSDAELLAWAMEYGFVVPDMQRIRAAFEETGEVPRGCRVQVNEYPETIGSGALKIDTDMVNQALGAGVGERIMGLLGGGGDA